MGNFIDDRDRKHWKFPTYGFQEVEHGTFKAFYLHFGGAHFWTRLGQHEMNKTSTGGGLWSGTLVPLGSEDFFPNLYSDDSLNMCFSLKGSYQSNPSSCGHVLLSSIVPGSTSWLSSNCTSKAGRQGQHSGFDPASFDVHDDYVWECQPEKKTDKNIQKHDQQSVKPCL